MNPYGIYWFRRDLRIKNNPALNLIVEKFQGNVLFLFCFDEKFLSRSDFSFNRFQFFLETLKSLKADLDQIGGSFLFLDKSPEIAFPLIFQTIKNQKNSFPSMVSWNRDYEPFARSRDENIMKLLNEFEIECLTTRDHLLVEPEEIYKESKIDPYYKKFTPFASQWFLKLKDFNFLNRIQSLKINSFDELNKRKKITIQWFDIFQNNLNDSFDDFYNKNKKRVTISIPKAGYAVAINRLNQFRENLNEYNLNRDFPAKNANSKLSIFLKNGTITVSDVIRNLKLLEFDQTNNLNKEKYLKELVWREFYYHLLYHFPAVETEAFQNKFSKLKWENNEFYFLAWKEGKTGFPIVDAGMRELNTTGLMHNRVRMIVASFLTKDLLIDWKWGERYFMEKLLDGDLAANNGGWQWSASTGCDAQPYFRIFNPWLQSKKYDPEGLYIKKFVPELYNVPSNKLHQPILDHLLYPKPIVDHEMQRKKALNLYK